MDMVMWECGPWKVGPNVRLFILVNVVLMYLVLGALVFAALEEQDESDNVRRLRQVRMDFALKIRDVVTDAELERFISDIQRASERGIQATNNVTFISSWNFGQSFFFVGSLLTTIGYGHTVPLSYNAKIFAIFYSLVGIPLTLIMFTAIVTRLMQPVEMLLRLIMNVRLFLTTREVYVRLLHLLIILLLLLIFFFFIPAGIFAALEKKWNYLDGLYYCFISLTTIGLGDYIPGEDENQPAARAIYKIATTFYLFLGLICVMVMITVMSNIKELYLADYFVLKKEDNSDQEDSEREQLAPEDDSEREQLTPKDATPPKKYTESDPELNVGDESCASPTSSTAP